MQSLLTRFINNSELHNVYDLYHEDSNLHLEFAKNLPNFHDSQHTPSNIKHLKINKKRYKVWRNKTVL